MTTRRQTATRAGIAFALPPERRPDEDADTQRLVTRFQAGDTGSFAAIYERFFDRVYGYLRVLLNDRHRAEDVAQQVFLQAFEALPRYQSRGKPFSAWLFTIVRNSALMVLRKETGVEVVDPAELDRRREGAAAESGPLAALNWVTDADLAIFLERLPLAQRQAILLRYVFDMSSEQAAKVMGRTPEDVRILQHRALRFLEKRLAAVGRGPRGEIQRSAEIKELPRQAVVLRSRRFSLWR
jgi:RNA polymerase sigma-70 factor (ECF subfamily)